MGKNNVPRKELKRGATYTTFQVDNWEGLPSFLDSKTKLIYWCAAPEECPTTGKQHIQGYVHFRDAKSFSAVQKLLQEYHTDAHIELAGGSPEQNKDYCLGPYQSADGLKTKEKNDLGKEWGQLPRQGKRNDLEEIRNLVNEGATMRDIIQQSSNYQALRSAEFPTDNPVEIHKMCLTNSPDVLDNKKIAILC